MVIRRSRRPDSDALEELYRSAFPGEELLPLVRGLLEEKGLVRSLVAVVDGVVSGHIISTSWSIDGSAEPVALLGPLAVRSVCQRQGIGGALVRRALRYLETDGTMQVQVLGDPAYYGRFGFQPDAGLAPPYPLPADWRKAWQSLRLREGGPPLQGTLSVPKPWRQPALWAP